MRRIRQFLASILVVALMAVLVNRVDNVSAHEMDTEGKLTENVSEEISAEQYEKYSPKWYALQSVYYLYSKEMQYEEK